MKYSDPLWRTNPVLAQVREALNEVEHIRSALKDLESIAGGHMGAPATEVKVMLEAIAKMMNLPALKRLDGWSSSLTESEIGLWAMLASKPQSQSPFAAPLVLDDSFGQRRKSFIDKQVLKWDSIMNGASVAKSFADLLRRFG